MELLSSIYLVAILISLIGSLFIMLYKCINNNRAKEIIIATPNSVAASSSVHVNVYCDSNTKQTTASARGGSAAAEVGGCSGDQRQIQDLKLTISTLKAPSVSTGDGSKVVHDGSKGDDSENQRQIQDLKLQNLNFKAPSVSTGNGNKVVHDGSKGDGSGNQRKIQDLKLQNSTFKVPSVSTRDGNKVVHDGSGNQMKIQDLKLQNSTFKVSFVSSNKLVHDCSGNQRPIQDLKLQSSIFNKIINTEVPSVSTRDGAKDVSIVIDGISGKVNTTVYSSSNGSANKCGHQKGYSVGVSVNGGRPSGGVRAIVRGGGGGGDD
ncbi:hypothetical protein HAX54_021312 [Datura stramonium]|uniref:Uncharacterized protein n=1 Tax=Datura stramonium TaxID=4076 RepID=A0ABS8UUV7_DATST|nr:hypothetical protein [Datura stramonium]